MARTLSIHRVIVRTTTTWRRRNRISAWDGERRPDGALLLQDETKKNADGAKERRATPGKGRMAVYVGEEKRRYVIPASYVCAPEFVPVMEMAREEYGYQQSGGLCIPCGVDEFDDILRRTKEKAAAGGGCYKRKCLTLINRMRGRIAV